MAFLSLWRQLDGLFGSEGIQPVARLMAWLGENVEGALVLHVPTVFWLGASDPVLHLAAGLGLALSVLLFLGVAPRLTAFLLWGTYLSFFNAGSPFLSFQWDVLLLEAGLLAVLYAPSGWLPYRSGVETPPSTPFRWLLWWLLFRLMLMSGVVKLASGDEVWWNLTALEVHYWTQPLPHRLSHFVHHLPAILHQLSCALMFVIELALPFLVFGRRRYKKVACAAFVLLMVLIVATGNYGFFNLLTVALCLTLLDDRALRRLLPLLRDAREPTPEPGRLARLATPLAWTFAVLVVVLTATKGLRRLGWIEALPAPVEWVDRHTAAFASFNSYGLFADMTETRPEIVIEGSLDGEEWRPYVFRYKPGAVDRPPGWAGFHMPRLDWQMWFAALRGRTPSPPGWYQAFLARLLEGSEPVLGLLEENPFPDEPPRFVRSTLYHYEFGSPAERADGVWWRRERVNSYCPTFARDAEGRIGRVR